MNKRTEFLEHDPLTLIYLMTQALVVELDTYCYFHFQFEKLASPPQPPSSEALLANFCYSFFTRDGPRPRSK